MTHWCLLSLFSACFRRIIIKLLPLHRMREIPQFVIAATTISVLSLQNRTLTEELDADFVENFNLE